MNYIANPNRTTIFTKVDNHDSGTFESSQNVRYWLVLRALQRHPAGEYVPDSSELEIAFSLVTDGVRDGRIRLAYAPRTLLVFDMPARGHALHLQAMVFWCARMRCSLEVLAEAYGTLGSQALLKDVFATIARLKREQLSRLLWEKTLARDTVTPSTISMPLN